MKNSQDWSEMLAGYVLGDLSSEEVIEVQRYLTEHPIAMTELAELQSTLALLPLGLPDVAVPEALKARILNAAIGQTAIEPPELKPSLVAQSPQVLDLAQVRSRREAQPQKNRLRRNWTMIGSGIAAAMITALGVQNYQLQQQVKGARQEIASLQQVDRETNQMATLAANSGRTLAMRGSGFVAGAAGKVYIVPQQNRALLAIENLPQPPAGKVYHLWAVVNGQKVSCIQFTPEQDGKVVMQIPANRWLQAVEVGVTLEAEQSGTMPAGEMVMQGQQI
jgi:anti-sigma factor RsiW